MPAPTSRDINRAVLGNLGMFQGLTSAQVTYVTFEPTLGITAGKIGKLGLSFTSFEKPLERSIKEVIIPSIQKNFDVGGRPVWEPLSEFTIKRRQHEGFTDRPLVKTGALQSALAEYGNWTVTPTFAVLSSLPDNVWYGQIQQAGFEGSGGGRRVKVSKKGVRHTLETIVDNATAAQSGGGGHYAPPIPARPFANLQPEDEDRITEIFIEWLDEQVALAWPLRGL
jgi:phage gpG-like protein